MACHIKSKRVTSLWHTRYFKYCNLIWMFCSIADQSRINQIQKRTLRCVYQLTEESLEQLLAIDNTFNIHTLNLRSLMLFMHKIANNSIPEISANLFDVKNSKYNLTSKILYNIL